MGNKCILCQEEAEIKVSFYEGDEVRSFYVCKNCGEYVAYRFLYLDRKIKKMEIEKEESDN